MFLEAGTQNNIVMESARGRRMSIVLSNDWRCPDFRHAPTNQQGHCAAQNNFSSAAKGNFQSARCRAFQYAGSNDECRSDLRNPPAYRQLDRIGADEDSYRQWQRKHPAFRARKADTVDRCSERLGKSSSIFGLLLAGSWARHVPGRSTFKT